MSEKFWQTKKLSEMNKEEWEALCDGCGRCCLNKVEYEDVRRLYFTDAACHLLDRESCRCSDYANRNKKVKNCIKLTAKNVAKMAGLPKTCAYRRLSEGRPLARWHPLVSNDPNSVHKAGISVKGRCVSENHVEDIEDHIVNWIQSVHQ